MTALTAALWVLILASCFGDIIDADELAYDTFTGRYCQANHRATLTLYTSLLLGVVAAVPNTAVPATTA